MPASTSLTPAAPRGAAQRGIQSIEVGGALLRALAHAGRPLALKDLALEAGMAPAKAHPYLVSFGKLGLIAQDAASGRYGLGPLAMQLGLISLQQLDPLALAAPRAEALAAACGHTVALAVWGPRGATIVHIAPPPGPVHVSMRHGTVVSVQGTASGRLFAAWRAWDEVQPLLRAEGAPRSGDTTLRAELAAVRAAGISRVQDLALPGVAAIAAPVFDGLGRLVLALTAIATTPALQGIAGDAVAQQLQRAAAELSARLGWRGGDLGVAVAA